MPIMDYDNSHQQGVTTLIGVGSLSGVDTVKIRLGYVGAGAALGWLVLKRPIIGALLGIAYSVYKK